MVFHQTFMGINFAPNRRPYMIRRSLILVATALLASCTTWNKPATDPALLSLLSEKPSDLDYMLRPGDIVQVDVFQEPDLMTRQRISQNGVISMPLIGAVSMAGKSAVKSADEIAARLDAKYVVKPYVTVSVINYAPRRLTILGAVRQPGSVSMPAEERLSLPEAIALAGGPSDIGDLHKVILIRKINGAPQQVRLDALGPDASNIEIREGDILRVQETIF